MQASKRRVVTLVYYILIHDVDTMDGMVPTHKSNESSRFIGESTRESKQSNEYEKDIFDVVAFSGSVSYQWSHQEEHGEKVGMSPHEKTSRQIFILIIIFFFFFFFFFVWLGTAIAKPRGLQDIGLYSYRKM